MIVDVVTIFPDYLAPLHLSLIGKAIDAGQIELRVHDLRSFTTDRHRTVDDTPYGGGPGMVMKPEPWGAALDYLLSQDDDATLVVPTPSGHTFTQSVAAELADTRRLIIACGRYEGIDARVVEDARRRIQVRELSIGDYVLAGGEAAALVIMEAVGRLLPGVLGNEASHADDSFAADRCAPLEAPPFTKPRVWRDLPVPEVLLSGDHRQIEQWRRDQSRHRSLKYRPDLIE